MEIKIKITSKPQRRGLDERRLVRLLTDWSVDRYTGERICEACAQTIPPGARFARFPENRSADFCTRCVRVLTTPDDGSIIDYRTAWFIHNKYGQPTPDARS